MINTSQNRARGDRDVPNKARKIAYRQCVIGFRPYNTWTVKKTDKSLTWNLPTTKHGEIGNAKMKVSGAPRGLFFQASRDAGERMNRCSFLLALIGAVVLASPALGTGFQSDEVEMSPSVTPSRNPDATFG